MAALTVGLTDGARVLLRRRDDVEGLVAVQWPEGRSAMLDDEGHVQLQQQKDEERELRRGYERMRAAAQTWTKPL